jgi:membrane AbrB-like protein
MSVRGDGWRQLTWEQQDYRRLLVTLGVGIVGGAAFSLLGLPLAWLSGPAVSAAGASIAGIGLTIPVGLRHASLIFLGSTMGSAITPETLTLLSRWPATLAGLVVCVFGIMAACSLYLERVHGYDRVTARLAAVPGALPYVLALAAESRGDQRRIAIIQMFRLAALLMLLPSVLSLFGHVPAGGRAAAVPSTHPVEIALLLAGGSLGAYIFARINAPAASLFGSMVAGALLYGTGTLTSPVPAWLLLPGFVIIGTTVGANFAGIERGLIADTLLAGIGSLLVGVVVAVLCALPIAWLFELPFAQLWLAYAPGGVDVMTIMALALGLDPAFVGGHHVARFLGLGFFVPAWLRLR